MPIVAAIAAPLTAALGSIGVGATTAGIIGTGLASAGLGAATSAITGGDPLTGALTGGLTAGIGGTFGGDIASGLGLSTGQTGALIGAGSGALASAITGQDPLMGAITGGASGYISNSGAPSPAPTTGTPATGAAGAGSSAVSGSLPGSISGTGTPDLAGTFNQPLGITPTAGGGWNGSVPNTAIPGIGSTANAFGALPGDIGVNVTPAQSFGALPADIGVNVTPARALGDLGIAGNAGGAGSGGVGAGSGNISAATPTAPTSNASGIGKVLGDLGINNAGDALGAFSLYRGVQQAGAARDAINKTVNQLQGQASASAADAGQLKSYLLKGDLPAGARAAVDGAVASAKAAVRSRYANLGLSGSSMEIQELNQIDQRASGQVFDIANQLYQEGAKESQIQSALYETILNAQAAQLTDASHAVTNYAAALTGGNYAPKAA